MAIEMRPLGDSGINIAPLALGGNVFGWTADAKTSFAILDAFVDAGGTMIDTADVYSAWVPGHIGGESETVIGSWLRLNPGKRERMIIATKVGFLGAPIEDGEYLATLEPDVIRSACEACLRRLGTDRIDLYYHHKDNPAVPLAESLGAMDALASAGKIRAVGLSQYPADRLDLAMATSRELELVRPCALQTWYNLVERPKLEGSLLESAIANGLAVLPFYSLANGFLSGKYRSRADLGKSVRGSRVEAYLEGKGARVLDALDEVAGETGAAIATIAVAWTMAQPGITAPIASATSLAQLEELTAALHLRLSVDQIRRLEIASSD